MMHATGHCARFNDGLKRQSSAAVVITCVLTLIALAGCSSLGGGDVTRVDMTGNLTEAGAPTWDVTLRTLEWRGNTVIADLAITNRGSKRAKFGYNHTDEWPNVAISVRMVAIDSQGNSVCAAEQNIAINDEHPFHWLNYPPGETGTGKLTFEMGPSSEGVGLYITYPNAQYRLFEMPREQSSP
jgi:hypothetical protein